MARKRSQKPLKTAECVGGPFDGTLFISEGFTPGDKYELTSDGRVCPAGRAVYQLLLKGDVLQYVFVSYPH